jgi:transcriptional regulator EpsA
MDCEKKLITKGVPMSTAALENGSIVREADSLLSLFQGALAARNQAGWSRWLQGEMQKYLPHDAVIAAWGDFKAGVLAYDVITRTPALSAHSMPKNVVLPLMAKLFQHWLAADQQPLVIEGKDLPTGCPPLASLSRYALVHGIKDHRSRYDCIYLFLGPAELATSFSRQLCRMALPFIDTGFRQLPDRGQKQIAEEQAEEDEFGSSSFGDCPFADAAANSGFADTSFGESTWGDAAPGERGSALSARELEIMQWVRMGKTNSEIAMILHLSTFTVKNHMRRIYKKLDVLNRAQAVGSLDRMQGGAQHAVR